MKRCIKNQLDYSGKNPHIPAQNTLFSGEENDFQGVMYRVKRERNLGGESDWPQISLLQYPI